jgi:hypothetical protein
MTGKDSDVQTFHSESAVLLIARSAKMLSWVILVIYLLSFISTMTELVAGGLQQFPPDVMNALLFIANLIYPLAIGLFYFLILNGVAQGLSIALDVYFGMDDEAEVMEFVEETAS